MNAAELRCYREALGLTPKWMAAYLGVAEGQYKRMEQDRIREGRPEGIKADQQAMVQYLWDWTQLRIREEISSAGESDREPRWIVYRTDEDAANDGLENAPDGPTLTAAWHRSVILQAQTVVGGPIQYFSPEALDNMVATPEDEAEIQQRYGKSTQELADEAEQGYPLATIAGRQEGTGDIATEEG